MQSIKFNIVTPVQSCWMVVFWFMLFCEWFVFIWLFLCYVLHSDVRKSIKFNWMIERFCPYNIKVSQRWINIPLPKSIFELKSDNNKSRTISTFYYTSFSKYYTTSFLSNKLNILTILYINYSPIHVYCWTGASNKYYNTLYRYNLVTSS